MPYKRRIHSAIAIELFFERKNHQCLVDILAQQLDASLPPRPELRADIVNNGNPVPPHLSCHPPVERRSVDDHGQCWSLLVCRSNQFFVESENFRKMAENFSDADHRQVLGVDHNLASSGPHAFSASAEEVKGWVTASQRLDQLRAVHFARGFAGGDENFHESIVTGFGQGVSRPHSSVMAPAPRQLPDPYIAADRACNKSRVGPAVAGGCPSRGLAPCASR